jgi:hypothetical protein
LLNAAKIAPLDLNRDQIARLVPKRNVETWILCLNDFAVDEEQDYKRTRDDWGALLKPAADSLYRWTRADAVLPPACVPSLHLGVRELRRLQFR